MAQRTDFPQFGEAYDGRKMRQLVSDLERIFKRSNRVQKKIAVVNVATYDTLPDDDIIAIDYTATGACTVNLPAATLFQGVDIIIKDRAANASSNNITVAAQSGDSIDGAADYTITTDGGGIIVASDGSDWMIVADF